MTTQGVGWASDEEASDLVTPPLNLVLYIHLRIFAYALNPLIASFEYMELILASGTLKNLMFLRTYSGPEGVVLVLGCTLGPDEVPFTNVTHALINGSRIQKVPIVSPTGGRTAIPSGRIHQKLSCMTVSLGIPSLILLFSTGVKERAISRARAAFHIVSGVRFKYCISSKSDVISSHMV